MTNFEKLLAALEELKATLLNAIVAADCSKAMERWLDREAPPTARERASELFGQIGSCKKCPAIEECRADMDADCIDILTAYVEAQDK